MQMISSHLEHHSPEMSEHALKIAVCNNVISMKYVDAILNNWRTNNIKTIEQESNGNKPRRQRKTRHVFKTSKYITNDYDPTPISEEERKRLLETLAKLEEGNGN
jgi:DNA replication protein